MNAPRHDQTTAKGRAGLTQRLEGKLGKPPVLIGVLHGGKIVPVRGPK